MNRMYTTDVLVPLIDRLDEPYRQLSKERYVDGMSPEAIADKYMLSPTVVVEDLTHARRRLLELALEKPERA